MLARSHLLVLLPFLVLSFVGTGCRGQVVVVDGIEVYESIWEQTKEDIERRASFELDCPVGQLHFSLIRRDGRYPIEVGVQGCGRRELYTQVGRTWFASGQGEEASETQRQLEIQAAQEQQRLQRESGGESY